MLFAEHLGNPEGSPVEAIFLALVGLSVGALFASISVPRIRWVPLIGLLVLVVSGVTLSATGDGADLAGSLVFVASTFVSSGLYSAHVWSRSGTTPGSFWELVVWSAFRPGYLRRAHQAGSTEEQAGAGR